VIYIVYKQGLDLLDFGHDVCSDLGDTMILFEALLPSSYRISDKFSVKVVHREGCIRFQSYESRCHDEHSD
jgi:hypothetical protein